MKKIPVLFLSLFIYTCITLWLNIRFFFPDDNDFIGLQRICLLMDQNLKYCINNSWGFMHPLLNHSLTQVTGNLLLSLRILSYIFGLLIILGIDQVMEHTLHIKNSWPRALVLLFIPFSIWQIDLTLNSYMDGAAIACVLWAMRFLNSKKTDTFFWSGVLISISYWFRFHFLLISLLWPALVWLFQRANKPLPKIIAATSGIIIGLSIPYILCYLSYGIPSLSNQKYILAYRAGLIDFNLASVEKLHQLTYKEIVQAMDYRLLFYALYKNCLRMWALLATFIFFLLSTFFIPTNRRQNWNIAGLIIIILMATLPFVTLRPAFTIRLQALIYLLSFPILAYVLTSKFHKIYLIFFIGIVVISVSQSTAYFSKLSIVLKIRNMVKNEILKSIPKNELQTNHAKILNTMEGQGFEFYNPYQKYGLLNTKISYGWVLDNKPMLDQLGYLDLQKLHFKEVYQQFDYIILPMLYYLQNKNNPNNLFQAGTLKGFNDYIIILKMDK